jgi:DnaK suppressor protein
MNPMQLEYFRQKLLNWKDELLQESQETLKILTEETSDTYSAAGDEVDRANDEALKQLELRARDRERKLIQKIDAALKRIEDGSYGYCEITDEPIGLKRLEARPVATMSVEAQEEHENKEKLYNN